ncbi:MAG: glutathione S-transferase family protein [Myxococcales bacterium]|nr:glutathione S-transferase family protein [Myxococcales bacterium]
MKLYYAPRTRSIRPRWALEEAGVDYDLVAVDLAAREHKDPKYREIHPLGRVPALVDGDVSVFESGAICLYVAEKAASAKLAPAVGAAERGLFLSLMAMSMAELDPTVGLIFEHRRQGIDASPILERAQTRWADQLLYLESTLVDRRPYMAGEFSVADIMIGSVVLWAQSMCILGEHPHVEAYAARLVGRPAYQRAAELGKAS